MKVMKKIMTAAVLAVTALAFFSCTMDAESNNGSKAATRLEDGYKEKPQNNSNPSTPGDAELGGGKTSQAFWKGYAPFIGIQVWTTDQWGTWGQVPDIDLDNGTISAVAASPAVMFPVFGAFDETGASEIGTYDCSAVRRIEFDVKANKSGGTLTFAEYLSGSERKHEEGSAVPTSFVHRSYDIPNGGDSVKILFYFNLSVPSADYVVTVNNIAFYDADGNQITDLPVTLNE